MHTTSSGIQIIQTKDGGVAIGKPGKPFLTLTNTEYRELVMYGFADLTTKDVPRI